MLKSILSILLIVVISAAQDYKTITDEVQDEPMLVGIIERDNLTEPDFSWWFDIEYDEYEIDNATLDDIKDELDDKEITIVLGTWCGDSHREVPRFFKILDYLEYDSGKVKLISVDRDKKSLSNEIELLAIERVPTFIFYEEENELGRITESPETSLEKDLQNILK